MRAPLGERATAHPILMSSTDYAVPVPRARVDARAIFGEVMGLVAVTCLFAAGGAYIGRDLTGAWWLVPWLMAIGCIIGLNVANARGQRQLALVLLFGLGLLLGISVGTTISYYATTDPSALYQATAATGLFVGALGAGGYATRRDLSGFYRLAFWLLLELIVAGIVTIFINMPAASLAHSIAGLGIFGLYVVLDFNRLRRAGSGDALTEIVTEHAIRIAGEGRKFGIYMLVASQRPAKVHENVLSQCDNLVLMRLNSASDAALIAELYGFVSPGLVGLQADFGLGEALIAGKFASHPTIARFGRRVAGEGGADVDSSWAARR